MLYNYVTVITVIGIKLVIIIVITIIVLLLYLFTSRRGGSCDCELYTSAAEFPMSFVIGMGELPTLQRIFDRLQGDIKMTVMAVSVLAMLMTIYEQIGLRTHCEVWC